MTKIYAQLLSSHIKHSDLTLREIAHQCKERGYPIDPSYISKLQTGRLPPPSEEVSHVLANVLGAQAEELIYWGYIEKAPQVIRQKLLVDQDLSPEIVSCAKRICKLPALYKQKIMDEIQWLERLEGLPYKTNISESFFKLTCLFAYFFYYN